MARSRSTGGSSKAKPTPARADWSSLTWTDLEEWAGSRSVTRGRTYQRSGRVKDLKISREGDLLATVAGGSRYTTTVTLKSDRKRSTLESRCTCPVGFRCKHAVAVVAEYLQAIAEERDVPVAQEDDPRWSILNQSGFEYEDDWDEEVDESSDEDEADLPSPPRIGGRKRPASSRAAQVNWSDKIHQHLRGKTQEELAELVWSLVQRFPQLYQEFRERIALQEGDVGQIVAETRREIESVTSEPAWQNTWTGEGFTPDYSNIQHRLERILDLGYADEVVTLGRELIRQGIQQVNEANDEGDTATALGECLPIVFQALARSSLSESERLLFAIEAERSDDFDLISESSQAIFDVARPEEWSAAADALTRELRETSDPRKPVDADFYRDYHRDRLTNWIGTALENAHRGSELRSLYESEARITGSYERLVHLLLDGGQFKDAEDWAKEGIAATSAKHPGIATNLAANLCEIARKRKQWDIVAAHAAHNFFGSYPNSRSFDELMKAARKARVEEPVRAAALHFLETGIAPYRLTAPRSASVTTPRARSAVKRSTGSSRSTPASPDPAGSPAGMKIDPGWPLPVPDYLVALQGRPGRYDLAPHPYLEVLLDMAIASRRPDEVLHWFDKMQAASKGVGYLGYSHAHAHADRVAEAVSNAYPERALQIYLAALDAQLPHAQQSAYENAVRYLRKLRPLYKALDRASEWSVLLESIREKYRSRPRFMDLLDGLEGRTIVQSARSRRKRS